MFHRSRFIQSCIVSMAFLANLASATQYVPISVGDITVIIPIDEAPVAVDDATSVDEDNSIVVDILANDTDEILSDIQSICTAAPFINCIQITSQSPLNATLDFSSGLLEFTAPAHWNGDAYVDYVLHDENQNSSNTARVSIAVNPLPDSPVPVDDRGPDNTRIEVEAYTWTTIDILANDYDPDGDDISIHSASFPVDLPAEHGQFRFIENNTKIQFRGEVIQTRVLDYHIIDSTGRIDTSIIGGTIYLDVVESSIPNLPPVVHDLYTSIEVDTPPAFVMLITMPSTIVYWK